MVCIATAVIDGYLIPQTVKCEKREFVRTVTYVGHVCYEKDGKRIVLLVEGIKDEEAKP